MKEYILLDCTGGNVSRKIKANDLDDAIECGKDWMLGGDWSVDELVPDGAVAVQDTDELPFSVYAGDADIYECEPLATDAAVYTSPEPECPVDVGWDFVGVTAMGREFSAYSRGGTFIVYYEVCRNTGYYMVTDDPGCQRNPGEPLKRAVYYPADAESVKWLIQEHKDTPEWLTDYLVENGHLENDDVLAYSWACREQGFDGTLADFLELDPDDREEYEFGAAGIATV